MKYINNERGYVEDVVAVVMGSLVTLIVLAGIGLIIWQQVSAYANRHQEPITIKEKIVKAGDKSSKYLLFTDKGVYENTDRTFIGKFDSSDVYASLEVGKTYQCDVMGTRNHFFSWYPNINSCK